MLKLLMTATAVAGLVASPAYARGNEAPSGQHYSLNIIGVDARQDRPDNAAGHVIFVDLNGPTKINLEEGDFQVNDKDGTDGVAEFQLPAPDENNDGTTSYSVFARALGSPQGNPSSTTNTCFEDATGTYCSTISMVLERKKGQSTFGNVSKYLLYIYVDTDADGDADLRVPLFADENADYWWDYTNDGLRLAQLRFYPCATVVPDADGAGGENGPQDDSACFN